MMKFSAMRLATLIILISLACAQDEDNYVDELEFDGDESENTVVALNEQRRSEGENVQRRSVSENAEPDTNINYERRSLVETSPNFINEEISSGTLPKVKLSEELHQRSFTDSDSRENNENERNEQKRNLNENEKVGPSKKSNTAEIKSNANTEYIYHAPKNNNAIESDDLMAQASPPAIKHEQPDKDTNKNIDDLMAYRDKRNIAPTFQQIHDFIYKGDLMSSVSNERRNELTATASVAHKVKSENSRQKRSKNVKNDSGETKGELNNIFTEIKASKHHKLTRSDIRQLAKKAVMLATLKKLDEVHNKTSAKKNAVTKPKKKSPKKNDKNKKANKKSEKQTPKKKERTSKKKTIAKKSESNSKGSKKNALSFSGKDVKTETQSDKIADVLLHSSDVSSKSSEFSEDISSSKKKSANDVLTDEAMEKGGKTSSVDTSMSTAASTASTTETKAEDNIDALFAPDKKTTIDKHDDTTKADDDIFTNMGTIDQSTEVSKKSDLPNANINDQIASLRSALEKTNPSKVPTKFLSDLPSGIRMIAWKKLLEKKKTELAQLETAMGGAATTSGTTETAAATDKPVMINIDIDQDKIEKDATAQLKNVETTDTEAEKKQLSDKDADDARTSQHVHYLQKHIKGARALRKLIAKTLVGHCKTTGKRILTAFVAMDKALARAQAIATVIGKKFNIDTDKIDDLVGDKEDQVVETFLRDIFTKI